MTAANKSGVAALNVYKKVAIIRKADDVLTYEDSEGTVKTVTDLHLAAAATVRLSLTGHTCRIVVYGRK
jgi:hypothetical protein